MNNYFGRILGWCPNITAENALRLLAIGHNSGSGVMKMAATAPGGCTNTNDIMKTVVLNYWVNYGKTLEDSTNKGNYPGEIVTGDWAKTISLQSPANTTIRNNSYINTNICPKNTQRRIYSN